MKEQDRQRCLCSRKQTQVEKPEPASSADQGLWVESKAQICPGHTTSFLTNRLEANLEQSIVVRGKNQTGKYKLT